jgi:hypothetical protein
MDMGGHIHASTALLRGKDTVPIVLEAGWAPGAVWTGAVFDPHDRPARSESLY